MKPIPKEFYLQEDVVQLSRDLLGKVLITNYNQRLTSGMIIETEAYCGPVDRASHAFQNRKTKRNSPMYEEGGIAYVYLCYGIHHLFNIVTNRKGIPHAILIRAIYPLEGIEEMKIRRRNQKNNRSLCSGPGSTTQSLGITVSQ